jgi:two-component system phosphate regulon sensor histidine kinase PhoR
MVVVAHDVTAEVQADQLKHDFVSLVSHELRTPLTPLKGFLRSLLDGVVEDAPEARYEYYRIMLRQTERLERLIADLLDVSQIESGNLLIEPQQIELGYLIRRQVNDYEQQHPSRILFHGAAAPLLVCADAMRVEQVVSNLISNALKYAPRETPIEVSVTAADGRAVVSVRDHGPGIAGPERERVFERFYRSDSATAGRTKGVGLGLFIARNLVEAMGGELGVSSKLGEGSTFAFALPLSYASLSREQAPTDRPVVEHRVAV